MYIEVTNVVGTFKLPLDEPMTNEIFQTIFLEYVADVMWTEAIDEAGESIYIPKALFNQSIFRLKEDE